MKYGHLPIGQRMDFKLRGTPPVEGAFVAQHLILHKAHGRAAQNQIDLALLPQMVNNVLETGGKGFLRFRQIRVLVNHKNQPLLLGQCGNLIQCIGKAAVNRERCSRWILKGLNRFGERLQILSGRGVQGRKIDGGFVHAKFVDQSRFSHSAPAIDYNTLKLAFLITPGHLLQLVLATIKHSCPPFFAFYILKSYFLTSLLYS